MKEYKRLYRLQISALVPEIFEFEKSVEYANEMTDDIIHSTQYYRKIHCLTSEFHVKFHLKNRYRTNREAMSAISVFQVKFSVEFTSQAVNFS